MQKIRFYFLFIYLKLKLFVNIKFQKIFQHSKMLFHLSFTVLVHYTILKILSFENGFPNFKQHTTCVILLYLNF